MKTGRKVKSLLSLHRVSDNFETRSNISYGSIKVRKLLNSSSFNKIRERNFASKVIEVNSLVTSELNVTLTKRQNKCYFKL